MDIVDKPFSLRESFPLHYLAKTGDFEEFEDCLTSDPVGCAKQIGRVDFKGRTILHYAASGVNLTGGERYVECALKFLNELEGHNKETIGNMATQRISNRIRKQQWKGIDCQETVNFINMKDFEGETAIHVAARNENANIVQVLLMHSANVLSISRKGEQALNLIYSYTPSAVIALLDQSVSFDYGVDSENFINTERSYCLDFTPVIGDTMDCDGTHGSRKVMYNESLCLSRVNGKDRKVRKEVLTHPLVRFFLAKKVAKVTFAIWTSLILHLLWISLYIWHAVEIYYTCCELSEITPQLSNNQSAYCSQYPFDSLEDGNWTEHDRMLAYNTVVRCKSDHNSVWRSIPISILTLYILVTIAFKGVILGKTYLKIQNSFLWIFTIFLLITLFPTDKSFRVQFQFSAFAIVIGVLTILEIVNKHVYWAIYIRVLIKVVYRFLAIVPLFMFIMLAFSTSLRMLFPTVNPPVKDLRNALMDVFSAIANGKVEWTEGRYYKNGVDKHFEFAGFVMFIAFYVTMILLLFRILIGFVVADTKQIQEEEEVNEISHDLKEIYLFESITNSRIFQWSSSFGHLKSLKLLRERFMLCPQHKMQLWLSESDIPKHLRRPMRVLASKNPVKYKPLNDIIQESNPSINNNNSNGDQNAPIFIMEDEDNNTDITHC